MDKDSEILFNQIQMEFKKIENWNNSKITSVEYDFFCERCSPQMKQIQKNLFGFKRKNFQDVGLVSKWFSAKKEEMRKELLKLEEENAKS